MTTEFMEWRFRGGLSNWVDKNRLKDLESSYSASSARSYKIGCWLRLWRPLFSWSCPKLYLPEKLKSNIIIAPLNSSWLLLLRSAICKMSLWVTVLPLLKIKTVESLASSRILIILYDSDNPTIHPLARLPDIHSGLGAFHLHVAEFRLLTHFPNSAFETLVKFLGEENDVTGLAFF